MESVVYQRLAGTEDKSPLHVLSTERFTQGLLDQLAAVSPRLIVRQQSVRDEREDSSEYLNGDEEIIYASVPPRNLRRVPALKWVQLASAGIDHLVDHPIWTTNIELTTASGIHAVPIGEFTLGIMLALARRLPRVVRLQERAEWPKNKWEVLVGNELRGKTVGIFGYGSIGREIARIAKMGFSMRVIVTRRSDEIPRLRYAEPGVGDPDGRIPERVYSPGERLAFLAASDYVVLAAPATAATRAVIGERELRAMKNHAYLINIARGELVEERALVRALKENWIAGAAMDAFAVEPLPRESQLWRMENMLVTPHIAGSTPSYDERAARLFGENLRRYVSGLPLLNVVSREMGY